MNGSVFKNEFKFSLKNTLIWLASASVAILLLTSLYPVVKEMYNMMLDYMASANLGDEFLAALGALRVDNYVDYFMVEVYTNLLLILSVYSVLSALNIIKKEYTNKTAEFLYSSPMKKSRINGEKYATLLLNISILNILIMGISVLTLAIFEPGVYLGGVVYSFLSMWIMNLVLASIVFAITNYLPKKMNIGLAFAIIAAFFMLQSFGSLTDSLEFLTYLSPMTIAGNISAFKDLDFIIIAIWLAVSTALVILSLKFSEKKDSV